MPCRQSEAGHQRVSRSRCFFGLVFFLLKLSSFLLLRFFFLNARFFVLSVASLRIQFHLQGFPPSLVFEGFLIETLFFKTKNKNVVNRTEPCCIGNHCCV